MTLINACCEQTDLGGGRVRSEHSIKPIAYRHDDGYLRRIASDWADGDGTFPHVVTASPYLTYTTGAGMRRICPTRDPARYFEIGAPFIKVGGVWTQVALGTAVRSANRLTWTTTNANVYAVHAGHYIKVGILLKTNWRPTGGQFAFPVGLNGLTRSGNQLLADGVPVMSFRPFHVEDYDNPEDVRAVAHDFVQVAGQWYVVCTLPTLETGKRWMIDPTLELQPAAAAGKDTFLNNQSGKPENNFGASVYMYTRTAASYRALIEFDVSSIASTATCTSSRLYTYKYQAIAVTGVTISTYSIASGNADWVEGAGNDALAAAGEPCWESRVADGAGGVTSAWAGSAGCNTSGTDYEAVAMGAFTGDLPATAGYEIATTLGATRTAGWFGSPNTNYGITITDGGGWTAGTSICSSDHATAAYRPKLTVEYTEAGGHPTMHRWYAIPGMTPGPFRAGRGW